MNPTPGACAPNVFTLHELRRVVAQASSLDERLQGHATPLGISSPENADLIDERWQFWRRLVGADQFTKRLEWGGHDPENARRLLGEVSLDENAALPEWAKTLNRLLQRVERSQPDAHHPFVIQSAPAAFEEILIPFVEYASGETDPHPAWQLFSEGARIDLERNLLQMLSWRSMRTLDLEFSDFREFERVDKGEELYTKFVRQMHGDGLRTLLLRYPVLARILAVTVDFWINNTREFLDRLQADWSGIQETFFGEAAVTRVTALRPGLSDLHQGNRTVIQVTFDGDRRLMYKPKPLEIEVFYNRLIEWLNGRALPVDLRSFRVFHRPTHGWAEHVEHRACVDERALERFYFRAGMLMCVASVFTACDLYSENIIADGEYPMIVDLETFLYPRISEIHPGDVRAGKDPVEDLLNTVLGTGMLPEWQVSEQGAVYDNSGLSRVGFEDAKQLAWSRINTDEMALVMETSLSSPRPNSPWLAGTPDASFALGDYESFVIDGYRSMYSVLLANRADLLDPAGGTPLTAARNIPLRFVFRDTRIYGFLREKSLRPEYLRCGVDRSILLEQLNYAFLLYDRKPALWPVAQAEQRAILQLDIPYFSTWSGSHDIAVSADRTMKNVLRDTAYERVVSNLRVLSPEILEQQRRIIRNVFTAYLAVDPDNPVRTRYEDEERATGTVNDSDPMALRQTIADEAFLIASRIVEGAFHANAGPHWLSFLFDRPSGRYRYRHITNDLYEGTIGILLFLAAAERVGSPGFRDFIRDASEPLMNLLQDDSWSRQLALTAGIGALSGMGSIVYGFVQIGRLLGEERYLRAADAAARWCDPRVSRQRAAADIDGAAGSVLALLSLYDVSGMPRHLEQALACGECILRERELAASGHRVWATNGRHLAGFAHGAAGMAYALLRLYAVTQCETLRAAADEALAYVRSTFSPQAGSWPDYRVQDQVVYGASWCNGAPGIGLAHLGCLPILDTPRIREDIGAALTAAEDHRWQKVDHACCGRAGRLEVLLVGGQTLRRPHLLQIAMQKAGEAISQAQQNGGYQLFGNLPPTTGENWGFFQGVAGIGYQWLRLAYPSQIPSVLLFEAKCADERRPAMNDNPEGGVHASLFEAELFSQRSDR